MEYRRGLVPGKTYRFYLPSRTTAGVPFVLAGSPVISCYRDGGTTEFTTGITLTNPFDSRTASLVIVDTTDATAFPVGSDFVLFISTGTVDGVSVVDEPVAAFDTRCEDFGIIQSGIITDAGSDTDDFVLPTGRRAGVTVGMVLEVEGIGQRFIATYNAGTGVGTVTTAFASDISLAFFRVRGAPIADTGSPLPASFSASERNSLATALLDLADGVETGLTLRNAQRVALAILLGELTGPESATPVFKSLDLSGGVVQSTTNRVTGASVGSDGARGKPVLDLS